MGFKANGDTLCSLVDFLAGRCSPLRRGTLLLRNEAAPRPPHFCPISCQPARSKVRLSSAAAILSLHLKYYSLLLFYRYPKFRAPPFKPPLYLPLPMIYIFHRSLTRAYSHIPKPSRLLKKPPRPHRLSFFFTPSLLFRPSAHPPHRPLSVYLITIVPPPSAPAVAASGGSTRPQSVAPRSCP